jgi:hypothetical protein
MGNPNSPQWNPEAQTTAIVSLLHAGADPNAKNMDGTTALHRAVRSRCSAAVRVLLDNGADPSIRTKNGSTAERLAAVSSGRGGSGSAEALDEQTKILSLFRQREQLKPPVW